MYIVIYFFGKSNQSVSFGAVYFGKFLAALVIFLFSAKYVNYHIQPKKVITIHNTVL